MRRLHALLPFVGRPAAADEVSRPGGTDTSSGRVDRRRLLGLIAAVPVAAPALARAATSRGSVSEWVTTFETVGADVQAGGVVLPTHVAALPLRLASRTELDAFAGRPFAAVAADPAAEREAHGALGLCPDAPPATPAWPPFIDDAGGGL